MATEEELQEAEASLSSLEYERDCLQSALAEAESRAGDAVFALQDAELELEDACLRCSQAQDNYEEVCNNYHDLEVEHDRIAYERDCYRAVLEGMEFQEIDSYPEKGHEFCHRLGVEAKEVTQNIMARLLEKK